MIRPILCSMTLAAMLWAMPSNAENTAAATAPIVNGEAGDSGDFNSTVAILLIEPDGTYSAHCTGTLIGARVVLTASHCIRLVNDDTNELEQTLTIDDLVVAVGALDAESAPDEKIRFADEIYYHDKFPNQNPGDDPEGLGQDYDIALIVLDKDVKSLPSTPVLPMNRFDKVLQEGDLVTISGYGNQGASDNAEAGELYIAETPYLRRSNYEFIAGEQGEPDACPGDSGGPVYVVDNGTRYVNRGREPRLLWVDGIPSLRTGLADFPHPALRSVGSFKPGSLSAKLCTSRTARLLRRTHLAMSDSRSPHRNRVSCGISTTWLAAAAVLFDPHLAATSSEYA